MWTSRINNSERAGSIRVTLMRAGAVATYQDVINSWQLDPGFCGWFSDLLAAAPFSAFRWETPPVTTESADRSFEFVLLDNPGLARAPQQSAFADQFRAYSGSDVLTFKNLGGDAIMVVPRPLAADEAYGHLAVFVRGAPEEQRRRLWQHVADAMAGRLSAKPVWLSTAGGGVSWLHVRLDDSPKYYAFAAYRTSPEHAQP